MVMCYWLHQLSLAQEKTTVWCSQTNRITNVYCCIFRKSFIDFYYLLTYYSVIYFSVTTTEIIPPEPLWIQQGVYSIE